MKSNLEFDNDNNSIATILNRNRLKTNLYQFTFDKVEIGHMDNEKGVFVSKDGKEYPSIYSKEFLKYNKHKVFAVCLDKDNLSVIFCLEDNINYNYVMVLIVLMLKPWI